MICVKIVTKITIILSKWILCRVWQGCRLIVIDVLHRNADILKYLKQSFSVMTESNGSVMWIVLLNQHMTVDLRDCEYTNGTKGSGCNRKYFSLSHISANLAVCGRL